MLGTLGRGREPSWTDDLTLSDPQDTHTAMTGDSSHLVSKRIGQGELDSGKIVSFLYPKTLEN